MLAASRRRREVTAQPGTCFLAISTNGSLSSVSVLADN